MGRKFVKVDVQTSKTTSETARSLAWTDNGGKISSLSPSLRKILAGLSIGQLMVVAVSAATLGAFVNSNMKEIDVLKQTTEHMQAKINLLESKQGVVASLSHSQDNETRREEIKSKIADVQTAYETDYLALSSNLTELKEEATKHKSIIHDHDSRLTQLELDNADCICNNTTIQDYGTRILRLEADNVDNDNAFRAKIETNFLAFSNNITELKNETATRESSILDHDTRIMQLELNNAACTCNFTSINDYDTRITQLEVDNVDNSNAIQILGATTTQLQLERTEDRKNMHTLNITTEQLALDISSNRGKIIIEQTTVEQLRHERKLDQIAIQNQNESIIKLGDDFSSQIQAMNAQNRSLLLIKEDVEKNRYSVQNINDLLAVLDIEMQTSVAAIEDNSERMSRLGHQINETNDLYHNLELRVSYLEAEDKAVLFDIKLLVTDGTVFPEGATIIFNQPIINFGNTYRTDLGIFEPPVNGVYSFTATICTVKETWMIIGLMKDGTVLDEFMIGDYLWHTCSTITAYTYVTTANTVFVKVLRTNRGILTSKMGVSSFKGILITTLKP